MWKKRPRGQLSKCCEAQALRKAFPEMIGNAPTADEMEGKHYEAAEIDITPKKQEQAASGVSITGADFANALSAIKDGSYDAASMRGFYALTPDQEAALSDLEKELK